MGVIIYKPECGLRAKEAYLASEANPLLPVVPDSSNIDIDSQFEVFEEEKEDEQ